MNLNELAPASNDKNDAYTRILRFATKADIVLTAADELIFDRWTYCNTLIKSRRFSDDDIIDKVREKFGVSKFTARNDISQTQKLFGAAMTFSKKYLLYHHAQDIGQTIERYKFDKSLVHLLPKLMDSYTKALSAIPEDKTEDPLPPPVFNFNIVQGQNIEGTMPFDDAMAQARALIQEDEQKESDYADFEDLTDESEPE